MKSSICKQSEKESHKHVLLLVISAHDEVAMAFPPLWIPRNLECEKVAPPDARWSSSGISFSLDSRETPGT